VAPPATPHTIRYDLYVQDTTVNYSGKPRKAIAINGCIPAPTLYFTEGDTAEIYVHNTLKTSTILHWHGVIVPNQYDGVPYLTTQPVRPGETRLFTFPVVQNGTYWYHSHFGFQEQAGLYGALVFYKRSERPAHEYPLVLGDWSDIDPKEISRLLHTRSDWFNIEKGTVQSYAEAIGAGYLMTKLGSEWKRMHAMDVSDVYYDRFLINGKPDIALRQFKAGDQVRLRVINGSSSTYFWLTWAGGKMTVIANDGQDIVPVTIDRLIIAVGETYDIIITIPTDGSYEFLATPEDRTKSASLWLGVGPQRIAPHLGKLKYFPGMRMMNDMMKMDGNLQSTEGMKMQDQLMDMNEVMYPEALSGNMKPMKMDGMKDMDMGGAGAPGMVTLNYGMLRSTQPTTLPAGPVRDINFVLTGNMERYVWSIDNKTLSEADKILIKKGERVRIVLFNNTMMRHPMHLHGHFFRLLNGQGEYSPLKHTLDIMPMEKDTIEFAASSSGDWFFHCHILYHMMSGMGRVFEYEDSPPNPQISDPAMSYKMVKMDDRMPYLSAEAGLETNGSEGNAALSTTRWQARTVWNFGWDDKMGYESETAVGRYLGGMQWLFPYIGFDYHYKVADPKDRNIFGNESMNLFGQRSDKFHRHTVMAGFAYLLPMLFVADARIDGNGKLLFQLGRKDIPVTTRMRFSVRVNTDKEYSAGLRYIITRWLSLSARYDSDMGFGGGVHLAY
jgi:FtsP/CotA-like multicopper oxidase with cupredoxin domain